MHIGGSPGLPWAVLSSQPPCTAVTFLASRVAQFAAFTQRFTNTMCSGLCKSPNSDYSFKVLGVVKTQCDGPAEIKILKC